MAGRDILTAATLLFAVALSIVGVLLWWPRRREVEARSGLGASLVAGAVVAFAIFLLQTQGERLADEEDRRRAAASERQARLLALSSEDDFTGIDLRGRRMQRFILRGKTMVRATLTEADLRHADLSQVRLDEARLTRARLEHARLDSSTLTGAIMNRADMRGARLRDADLTGAQLCGADLSGAVLDERTSFAGAEASTRTLWPDAFDPAAAGVDVKRTCRAR
jgi:uncharacterized protein YjbI with pentapeptide repeats